MLALRKAGVPVRVVSIKMFGSLTCLPDVYAHTDVYHKEGHYVKDFQGSPASKVPLLKPLAPLTSLCQKRSISSQVGLGSDKEGDLDEGFSDLEIPPETEVVGDIADKYDDEELNSEGDNSESVNFQETETETETDLKTQKKRKKKNDLSPLLKIILDSSRQDIRESLDNWIKEGNSVERSDISSAFLNLRKRKLFHKALQFSEWLEESKSIDLDERDYLSRLDLIAKVQGLHKAEKYIQKIPESFHSEIIYRTLLANCVSSVNVRKAEEVFNKIRELGFPMTVFTCNQLLLLYKRVDRKKISDVLLMMEKDDVKPNLFTYRLLADTKGISKDMPGMELIVETMKANGVEPDLEMQAMIARHYINAGLSDKALAALKEIEGDNISDNRPACKAVLPLYASLGQADDVGRIWKVCEANPWIDECLAAIESWGKLGKVENAEEVFEKMFTKWKRFPAKYYNALLNVYANHKLLLKGKDLAKRMLNNGCKFGPLTWDVLVKLYVEAGEVEKADAILHKATTEKSMMKPLYSSYLKLLDSYAQRGDIHNAEKIFERLRHIGYTGRLSQFQLLLKAYTKAKTPAYGFRERMKADNIFPNKAFASQLAAADAFKKSHISNLLD